MRRWTILFWAWIVILAVISILAIALAIKIKVDLGIFVATAVATISYPLFALADRYVWTPELKILSDPQNDPDLYRPSLVLVDPAGQIRPPRIMIRVAVYNKGSKTAKSCVGEIERVERPQGCEGFSKEPKLVQWTRSIQSIDILPKQKATLEVAFSELGLALPFGGRCAFQTQPCIKAWASTPEAIRTPNFRLQDGFCEGDFRVKVTVYSENSDPVTQDFIISIGATHQDLRMRHAETN